MLTPVMLTPPGESSHRESPGGRQWSLGRPEWQCWKPPETYRLNRFPYCVQSLRGSLALVIVRSVWYTGHSISAQWLPGENKADRGVDAHPKATVGVIKDLAETPHVNRCGGMTEATPLPVSHPPPLPTPAWSNTTIQEGELFQSPPLGGY